MNRTKKLFPDVPVNLSPKRFNVFAVYDYETDGISKAHSQITQFAAIKTDADLNIIEGAKANILVKPRIDSIPGIGAYKVTKIDIDQQIEEGVTEFELSQEVFNFFSDFGTSICGYNTISFDDEMTRNLNYRNQRDVYGHEWRNGNGRVDFYNLLKMAFAYKETTINFPVIDGKTSLRLEKLSEANGIIHENAHDALSDVEATISLAKMLKDSEPRLFDYFLNLSDKKNVLSLLDSGGTLLLTDNLFGQENRLTTAIVPIYKDETNANKYICVDLRHDPEVILKSSKEEVKRLMFTKREELEEGAERIPVVSVTANKQPILIGLREGNVNTYFKRFNLERAQVERNLKVINENLDEIISKIKYAYGDYESDKTDVYSALYEGFIDRKDSEIRGKCWRNTREKDTKQITQMDVYKECLFAKDPIKIATLMLRAKWNNHYNEILMSGKYSRVEFREWVKDLKLRLSKRSEGEDNLTFRAFKTELANEKNNPDLSEEDRVIIGKLENYVVNFLEQELVRFNSLLKSPEMREEIRREMEEGSSYTLFKNQNMANNKDSYDPTITNF